MLSHPLAERVPVTGPGGLMPMSLRRVVRLALVSLVGLAPASLTAQSVSGSVSGTVVDQTRQVLPRAALSVFNELTRDTRTTATNEVGVFVISAVKPGTYTLRVELNGFATFERQNLVLPPNETLSAGTIQLKVGSVAESVTITAVSPIVQTTSSEHSALITSTQLEQVADRGRDVISLLRVLPGVAYTSPSEAPGNSFGSSTPNINGNRATW